MNKVLCRVELWFAAGSLSMVLAGCVEQPWLVPQTPAAPTPYPKAPSISSSSVQQTSGRYISPQQARVEDVSHKLLEANKVLGLKPRVEVQGGAAVTITHQSDHRVVLTEGPVNACETDGQLAAVL